MKLPAELLLDELPLIERIIGVVSRRADMGTDDLEEFSAQVKLRLIENDYAILRAFRGRSSFGTYMTTVIGRLLNDYRNHRWGRWYTSAVANRLGPAAVELERLLQRDGRPLEDAIAVVRALHPEITRETLERLADEIPARERRRWNVEISDAEPLLAHDVTFAVDHQDSAARISQHVSDFVDSLPETQRRILRLRFDAELPAAHIARILRMEPAMVYRTLYRLVRDIRAKLETEGFSAAAVEELIGNDAAPLDFHLREREAPSEPVVLADWRKTHDG